MSLKININSEHSKNQSLQIKTEVKKTAVKHLNSKNAKEALSHYTINARIMSNGSLFESYESFSNAINDFYANLFEINFAEYTDTHIEVLSAEDAHFSTKFHWISTDIEGVRTELYGVWSASFVLDKSKIWKMSFRHESFTPVL